MQGDLELFERLAVSLPARHMHFALSKAKEMRRENAAKQMSRRLNVICVYFEETSLCFKLFANIKLRIDINRNNNYFNTIYAYYEDGISILDYRANWSQLSYHWNDEPLFDEMKRICGFDVRNPHCNPSASFLDLIKEITVDYIDGNIYYKRQKAYELLAIHKFRKDSIIATLPLDVLKIIINKIF